MLACTQDFAQAVATRFRRTDGMNQGRPFTYWFGRGGSDDWSVFAKCDDTTVRGRYPFKNLTLATTRYSMLGGKDGNENAGQISFGDDTRGAGPITSLSLVAIPSWPLSIEVEATEFDQMILRKQEKTFEARLRSVEPKLESVRALQPESKRVLFADVGLPEMIPLSLLGQGVLRLTSIFIRALGAKADILLIDEIENGLHHGALVELWKGLKELSDKEGTQIFATTHSMECIAAASQVFGTGPDAGLSFHRIEDVKGVPTAISIDATLLAGILEDGFEIR